MKTRIAWIAAAFLGALVILLGTQTSRTAAGTHGEAPLALADTGASSQPIIITTTADSLVLAAGENSRIVLYSSGEIVIKGKSIRFDADSSINLNLLGSGNIALNTESNRINLRQMSGAEAITIGDRNDDNYLAIDNTNDKITMLSKNGSADIYTPHGTTDLKAITLNVETAGDMSLKAANLKTEAKQDYSVKATNVKQEATMDYKEKGMNVKSEASMEHKTKGMNVTSEAGVNMQVKGTMVTVQSSGPNTIKGMPILIN